MHPWKHLIRLFAILLLLAIVVGWWLDAILVCLLVTIALYTAYVLWSLHRFERWLIDNAEPSTQTPLKIGDPWDSLATRWLKQQRNQHSQQVALQNTVDYLRGSLASLADAVIMVDAAGCIEWSNPAAKQLLGLNYPADSGQPLTHLIRQPEFITFYHSGDYHTPLTLVSPIHPQRQLQYHITFFAQGSRLLRVQDATKHYRLEQMRSDFVANVSHELRTPLTVISGYLDTLATMDTMAEPHMQRVIEQMLAQSQRMQALINGLLLLARLEHVPDKAEQKPIAVCALLTAIREDVLSAVNHSRQIDIECDASLLLIGNKDELQSAFSNLVMNAARYTATDGHIQLRWHADKDHAYLAVQDNGIGIEARHLPRLSERFYRVDKSRSMHTGGAGLGLAITKHVLLRHHGELQVSSQYGKGSTFTCVFPLKQIKRIEQTT